MFRRENVSTQRVEGINRWAKEGRLTKRKKPNDVFDALMVIVGVQLLARLRAVGVSIQGIGASQKLSEGSILDLSKL